MNHTSEELFSVFFSTVFESSCISDFTQKMASFFKRYMPVSAVYISFFEKDTIFKVAEYADYSKNPFPDQITIPEDTLRRMYIEDNFFTGDVHSIKNFTGEETCVFSEFRNSIFNNEESSSIYIPLKHHVLEGIHIYMSIYSIGKNRYSQEAIDICSFIQPMLIDTFNSILLYNDMNALKHSFIAERHPSANKNIKEKYEDHHNVNYTDAALEACVKLTERYITDRNFPDKAIDALDEAGSRVHLINITAPKEIEEQEKLIDETKSLKNEAVRLQNFELAASYRDKEKEYTAQLDALKEEWEKSLKENRETVDEEQIADVVSMISGVPVQKMAQAEGMKLLGMKDELLTKVIGQDKAIATLVKAIQRSRVGLKDPNKPIGTFMFLGPTGVGKTHLAKELSRLMFGSTDALIRIDMSEYMEKFTVSRLVGAPPGYVGYEEGGQLTEKVRRRPYSIVLLDEIEKAHPDVFNILLQVMDEGRLTDSYGRTVDFKNTVVIMTSNVGTRQLKEFGKGIGFTAQVREDNKEYAKGVITKALNKSFAPEFINRLDEIINFDQLNMEALVKIIDIELKGLYQRMENIGYKMVIDDDAKRFIASKGYDIQFGARPLKRAIQNYLEDGLSEIILSTELQSGDTIKVSYNKEKDAINMTVEK